MYSDSRGGVLHNIMGFFGEGVFFIDTKTETLVGLSFSPRNLIANCL